MTALDGVGLGCLWNSAADRGFLSGKGELELWLERDSLTDRGFVSFSWLSSLSLSDAKRSDVLDVVGGVCTCRVLLLDDGWCLGADGDMGVPLIVMVVC